MKGRLLRQDQRSVSDIYGTLLIISLAFVTSLLLVGGGWVVVDQIQSEAEDSLAQDNVENIDQGINELAGGSANETKTFQIPENTGENYEAAPDAGIFKINITTDEDYWSRTKAKQKNLTNGAGKEIVLGTIRHEAEDGTVTAFQGGGLWRQPPNSDTIFIESTPNLNFADGTLNLGIVNLTNAEAITEGSEITATRDGNTRSADSLKEFMEQFYTDRYNRAVTAPIQVNITIESEYADGWAKHAEERMGIPSSNVHQNFNGSDDMIRIEIPEIGDGMPDEDSPAFGDDDILYSGSSDWAYEYQNDSVAYGALEDSPPGSQWAYKPTLNESAFDGGDIDTGEYEFAVYNESGRWLIYNDTADAWETADGTVVDPSNSVVFNTTSEPNAVDPGNHEFWIKPPAQLPQAGAAPICIVTNSSGDADVRQHLLNGDDGCLENMVGVNEDLIDPIPTSAEFNITVEEESLAEIPTNDEMYVGEEFDVKINLTNVGKEAGKNPPIGVYLINGSNWNKFNKTDNTKYIRRAYPVAGTESTSYTLDSGDSKEEVYTVNLFKEMKADQHQNWSVFVTTGAAIDWISDDGDTVPDNPDDIEAIEIKERKTDFEIQDVGWSGTQQEGEKLTFQMKINETAMAMPTGETQTQTVRIETEDRIVAQKEVTLGAGEETPDSNPLTFEWNIGDGVADSEEVTISTWDDTWNKTLDINEGEVPQPSFDIKKLTVNSTEVNAGQTLEVTAKIKNVGDTSGKYPVFLEVTRGSELVSVPDSTSAYTELDSGSNTTVDLEWQTSSDAEGEYTLAAEIDGNSSAETVTVNQPQEVTPQFDISVNEDASVLEVIEGQDVKVDADVTLENADDLSGNVTEEVVIENFDGGPVGTVEVTINASNPMTNVELNWSTFIGYANESNWDSQNQYNGDDAFESEIEVLIGNADATPSVQINAQEQQREPLDVMFVLDESGSMDSSSAPDEHSFDTDTSGSPPYNLIDKGHIYLGKNPGNNVEGITIDDGEYKWSERRYKVFYTSDNPSSLDADWTIVSPDVDIDVSGSFIVYEMDPLYEGTNPASNLDGIEIDTFNGNEYYEIDSSKYNVYYTNDDPNSPDATWWGGPDTDEIYVTDPDTGETRTLHVVKVVEPQDSEGLRISATKNFAENLTVDGDQAGAVNFNTYGDLYCTESILGVCIEDTRLSDDTSSIQDIEGTAGGSTNIGAGMDEALYEFEQRGDNSKQVMVLLTDGFNNQAPDYHVLQAAQEAKAEGITIYTVGLGPAHNPPLMKEVASMTGGEYYPATDNEELNEIFNAIENEATEDPQPEYKIEDVSAPVDHQNPEVGDIISVDVTINNTGDDERERPVVLRSQTGSVISKSVNVSTESTETVTLEWNTTDAEAGDNELDIFTPDDSNTTTVYLNQSGPETNFKVQEYNPGSSTTNVELGETVTLNATIKNKGETGEGSVSLITAEGDQRRNATTVTVESGETKQIAIEWTPTGGDVSGEETNYEGVLETSDGDTRDEIDITIANPDAGPATIIEADEITTDPDSVPLGQMFEPEIKLVTADDSESGSGTVQIELENQDTGEVFTAYEDVKIQSGGENTTTVKFDTSALEQIGGPGEYDYRIRTFRGSEEVNGTVEIKPRKYPFKITGIEPLDDEIVEGGEVQFEVTVEKTRTSPIDEANVVLNYTHENTVVDYKFNIGLDSKGDKNTTTLTWNTWYGTGNDDTDRKIAAEIPNTGESVQTYVTVKEKETTLDGPSLGDGGSPIDIDLSEIEIGS